MTLGRRLLFLGYFVAEMAGAVVALVVVAGWLDGRGDVVAMIGATLAAIATAFAIDRVCKWHTGDSVLDGLPFIP